MFSATNLLGGLLFSGIGFVAFMYGKKLGRFWPMLLGFALMLYPYFVSDPLWLYGIGTLACAALYFTRDRGL
jgi:hypothetical protein